MFERPELIALYRNHPQHAARILERVRRQRGGLAGVDELDLARDRGGGVTDQNHVGGLQFVQQLAEHAGIGPHDYVLDLGCGLGGSARALARLYGCRVYGIDLSHDRCGQAAELSQLVGLDQQVCFHCADFLESAVPEAAFDVIWGQSAWGHVHAKGRFIRRWARALRPRGRIAFEEPYLKRPPRTRTQARLLADLGECWMSYFAAEAQWLNALAPCYQPTWVEDLSPRFLRSFAWLLDFARGAGQTPANSREIAGWHHARKLAQAEVLGYLRIVGTRTY